MPWRDDAVSMLADMPEKSLIRCDPEHPFIVDSPVRE